MNNRATLDTQSIASKEISSIKKEASLKLMGDKLLVSGEVRFESVVNLFQKGMETMRRMHKITVDLTGLTHCDSSILALCSAWVREMHSHKKEITFVNLPPFMRDLVRVHGLDLILPIS